MSTERILWQKSNPEEMTDAQVEEIKAGKRKN